MVRKSYILAILIHMKTWAELDKNTCDDFGKPLPSPRGDPSWAFE